MKRKEYEKPAAEVVELKIAGMLMLSGDQVVRPDYGEAIEETWAREGVLEEEEESLESFISEY